MNKFLDFWANLGKRRRTEAVAAELFDELERLDQIDGKAAHERVVAASGPHNPTRQECQALVDVCARLPLRQRLALEMSLNGYSADEVAKSLGITRAIALQEIAAAFHTLDVETPE